MGNEIQRIAEQLSDLQHGDCFIGMNLDDVLSDLTPEQALKKLGDKSNNIWELVNHIIYWRKRIINRLTGIKEYPNYPDLSVPEKCDQQAWDLTLASLRESYEDFRNTIEAFPEDKLDLPSPRPEFTYYELMHGIIQHDGYHMGQITLLKKYLD